MLKKITIFGIVIFLFTFAGFIQAQDRNSDNLPVVGAVMSALRKADGWALQDNGVWIKSENKLPNSNADRNKTDDEENALGRHNFKVVELREVMVHGQQYVVMLVESKSGRYKFKKIKQGWNTFHYVSYYVFRAAKLKEILPDSSRVDEVNLINLDLLWSDVIEDFDRDDYLVKISGQIQKVVAQKLTSPRTLLMAAAKMKSGGKAVVRFRLIEVFNQKNIYFKYFVPDNQKSLLDKVYYEVPMETFVSFIKGMPVFEALDKQPKTYLEFFKRGIAQFDRGDYYGALADFDRAIAADPLQKTFLIYAYIGSARFTLGEYDLAEAAYNIGYELKPEDPSMVKDWYRMLYNRGLVRHRLKDSEGACADWQLAQIYGIDDAKRLIEKYCK